jgi:hypothetical protein
MQGKIIYISTQWPTWLSISSVGYAKQCDLYCLLILHQTDLFLQETDIMANELRKIKHDHLEIWLLQTDAYISKSVVFTALIMNLRFCGYFKTCG